MRDALQAEADNTDIQIQDLLCPELSTALGNKLKFFPDDFQVFMNGVKVSGATNFALVERKNKAGI